MNSRFVKTWFIIAGSFAGLSVVYYIVRIFDNFLNSNSIEGTLLDKLNVYALILLGIAFIMLVAIIPLSKSIEKKNEKQEVKKVEESTLLEKYKTKKTK